MVGTADAGTGGPSIIPSRPNGPRRNLFVSARDRRLRFNLRSFPGSGFRSFGPSPVRTRRIRGDSGPGLGPKPPTVFITRRHAPVFPAVVCSYSFRCRRLVPTGFSSFFLSLYAHFSAIFHENKTLYFTSDFVASPIRCPLSLVMEISTNGHGANSVKNDKYT